MIVFQTDDSCHFIIIIPSCVDDVCRSVIIIIINRNEIFLLLCTKFEK